LIEALRVGRVFIGFNVIADSRGFRWFSSSAGSRAVMGESQSLSPDTRLHALSPLPCRFTVLRDGEVVHQQEGRSLEWKPTVPGKYRVEAELSVRGNWVPWVYANPIRLLSPL
jgi:hypothetical protein